MGVHEPRRDRSGWDFLVEFPARSDTSSSAGPLDKRPAERKAFLQVKSTNDPDKRSWSIKLSNWDKLIRSQAPTFFLILHFNGRDAPEEAFLVPVWEEQIRKVQKRLRELSAEGAEDLHRKKLNLTWDEENRLSEPSGQALINRMRKHIGEDLHEYLKKRQELIDTVGYEEAAQQLLVRVKVPEEYRDSVSEMWVDLALGLLEELKLAGGEVQDVRFGIPSPEPEAELAEGGVLRPSQLAEKQMDLTLRTDETGKEVHVPGTVISPAGVTKLLTSENLKFRFTTPLLDLVFHPHREALGIDVAAPEEAYPLAELGPSADLLRLLDHANGEDQQVVIEFDGLEVALLSPVKIPSDVVEWATALRDARDILQYLEVPVAEVEIRPGQIGQQSTDLGRIAGAIRGEIQDKMLWFNFEEGICEEEIEERTGEELYIPSFPQVVLGHRAFLFVLVDTADGASAMIKRGSRLEAPVTSQTIEHTEILEQGKKTFSFDVDVFLRRLEARLEGPGEQLIAWWADGDLPEA